VSVLKRCLFPVQRKSEHSLKSKLVFVEKRLIRPNYCRQDEKLLSDISD
jgi:hypothetical protein